MDPPASLPISRCGRRCGSSRTRWGNWLRWWPGFGRSLRADFEGLFHCYQVKGLPRTNNGLERFFGTARHIERRATGRKRASPALVVRGAVRVVAAGASQLQPVSAADLRLGDVTAWRALRQQLAYRHEGRRAQVRFRKDPQAYLAALEQRLFTSGLPS